MVKPSASTITRVKNDLDLFERVFDLLSQLGPLRPDRITDDGSEYLALRMHVQERINSSENYVLNKWQMDYLAERYKKEPK